MDLSNKITVVDINTKLILKPDLYKDLSKQKVIKTQESFGLV